MQMIRFEGSGRWGADLVGEPESLLPGELSVGLDDAVAAEREETPRREHVAGHVSELPVGALHVHE